jgi:hypothetical protein
VEEGSSKLLASVPSLSLTVWLENRLRTKSMFGRWTVGRLDVEFGVWTGPAREGAEF